jgi:hypothetical protein
MNHLLMRTAVTASAADLTHSLRHHWCFVTSVYVILLAFAILLTIVMGTSALWIIIIAVMFFEHIGNDVFYLFSSIQRHLSANVNAFLRGAAWILVWIQTSGRSRTCLGSGWPEACSPGHFSYT